MFSPKKSSESTYLSTDFTLGNCLFGAVKLLENANPGKYHCVIKSVHIRNYSGPYSVQMW